MKIDHNLKKQKKKKKGKKKVLQSNANNLSSFIVSIS